MAAPQQINALDLLKILQAVPCNSIASNTVGCGSRLSVSTGPSIFPLNGSTDVTGVHLGPRDSSTCSRIKVSTSCVYAYTDWYNKSIVQL